MSVPAWVQEQLDGLRRNERERAPRAMDLRGPRGTIGTGDPVVTFASNDYLGLSAHPAVVAAAHAALDRWGTGAGASRLVTGSRPVHHALEAALAAWKGTERAVVFASGYAANIGVLVALGGPDALICSDERNHASIIDGCRLSGAEVAVYAHGDHEHASRLAGAARAGRRVVIVTDRVFSMDGDVAPLAELSETAARHGGVLVVDEAHHVLEDGLDLDSCAGEIVRVGTLSKTLGAQGGFVAARAPIATLLVNAARSYIFTTALTPADAAAALSAVGVVCSPEGTELQHRLRLLVDRVAPDRPSPIVPILLGSESRALAAARHLLTLGLVVPAIRPPTVAPGTSRLRVTLSAAHRDDEVTRLVDGLAQLSPA